MSTSSQSQSRAQILDRFHEITGLNLDDCIHFLDQYNWNLHKIVNDYYNGKDFGKKPVSNEIQSKSIQNQKVTNSSEFNKDLGTYYTKNDRKDHLPEDDDRYYAELLQKYGDSDESARRQTYSQNHQQAQQQAYQRLQEQYNPKPAQQQSKEDNKVEHIYHEKQQFLRCGIHSLNNLFQIPHLFTHEHLDSIMRQYDKRYVNNDYGKLWIGDYDLRVLIEAITGCGYQVRQINYYHNELQYLPWDSYFGLLININGAHWFTIKNLNGIYYNLDSTLSKPAKIGQKNDLVNYLIRLIHKFNSLYIFAVLQQSNYS